MNNICKDAHIPNTQATAVNTTQCFLSLRLANNSKCESKKGIGDGSFYVLLRMAEKSA